MLEKVLWKVRGRYLSERSVGSSSRNVGSSEEEENVSVGRGRGGGF